MSENKPAMDPEAILATLDQITKTIEVLAGAVTRLQRHIQANIPKPEVTRSNGEVSNSEKKLLH